MHSIVHARAASAMLLLLSATAMTGLLSCRYSAGGERDTKPASPHLGQTTPRPEISRSEKRHDAFREVEAASGYSDNQTQPPFHTEEYSPINENIFHAVKDRPLSTFSIDVDTASYSNLRRFVTQGELPPVDAVRIEEMVNYFRYQYPQPETGPFHVAAEQALCPWNPKHRLVLVGIQGRVIASEKLPPRNLVFLLDTSGSMDSPNKLPLLKRSLRILVEELNSRDSVSIVAYAGSAGLVLPPTPGSDRKRILEALDRLEAGGSTNGGQGIELAYKTAIENLKKGGVNRVILATDGDFNVGVSSDAELVRLIEEKRKSGVFLTVLGFGMGNYKDSKMEQLADKGNGNYAYIDTFAEARKVLGEQAGSTLITIAKDVKIQVEFNPAVVAGYRLIGYENRLLRDEDFNDDTKDAGEIGAGHTVTALYEIVPTGEEVPGAKVDPLKYQKPVAAASSSEELLTVKIRYKDPEEEKSRLIEQVLKNGPAGQGSSNLRFAAAVATYGMVLRESTQKGTASYDMALQLARENSAYDPGGYRAEMIRLIEMSRSLKRQVGGG